MTMGNMENMESYCIIAKSVTIMYPWCYNIYYNMTNTRFLFVCWGPSANIQPAHCLHTHTHTQTGGPFTPPYRHLSLLKSKHHLWSPVSLFPPRPSNERAHSVFPPSLAHTLSVTSAFQPSLWLTLGPTDVTLSIFYLFFWARGTSRCSPGYTRTKSSYNQVWGHINTHTEIGCIHFVPWRGHSVVGGWEGGVTAAHIWLTCLT